MFAYESKAASAYARMQVDARNSGCTLSVEDGMVAAICAVRDATLATRNTKDFAYLDIRLVGPFEEASPEVEEIPF